MIPPGPEVGGTTGGAARTPVLLIAGFLGAGKTTLLSGWLRERPPHERWAVLVNEFGALGVDAALLAAGDADGLAVEQVAGGCACCAAQVAFTATLVRLLRRGPWHRLLVETSGLGHPAELVDRLRAPALAPWLEVLPPVAVVDATRAGLFLDPAHPHHEIASDQVALARLVVLNRAGAVPHADAQALAARLGALAPWPRPVVATADGTVPLGEVLAGLSGDDGAALAEPAVDPGDGEVDPDDGEVEPDAGPGPGRVDDGAGPHGRPLAAALGRGVRPVSRALPPTPGVLSHAWRWSAERVFDRAALQAALEALAGPAGPWADAGLLRAKGVFRTERAWYGWQRDADGSSRWQGSAWRADNRLEVLVCRAFDPQMVDDAIRAVAGPR